MATISAKSGDHVWELQVFGNADRLVARAAKLPALEKEAAALRDYDRDFERNIELSCAPAPAIRPLAEGGFRLANLSAERPVGLPDGRLTTPISRQNTPRLKPVPSALEQASLAAKRLA